MNSLLDFFIVAAFVGAVLVAFVTLCAELCCMRRDKAKRKDTIP